jgi:flagellar hook assembly protein FlgD
MHPAYPNPFNPVSTIKYELPKDVHVKLSVYNINGQKIRDLINNYQEAGIHEVKFDGSKLPSGMYFYRITAGNFSDVKHILLIK